MIMIVLDVLTSSWWQKLDKMINKRLALITPDTINKCLFEPAITVILNILLLRSRPFPGHCR